MLKRLIEVALPLKEVSEQSAREKSIRHGHISTLHIWWARRPLAACRAAVFASLIPDPDDPECPEDFRKLVMEVLARNEFRPRNGNGSAIEDTPRNRCLEFIKRLVRWENSNEPNYIEPARRLIAGAHKFLHPDSDSETPKVLDPFAGGGAIPLEALRLGCESHAVELNPVAHLIELCTLVYPQKYGQPDSRPVPDYIKRLIAHNRAKRKAKGEPDLFDDDETTIAEGDEIIPDVEITEAEYRKNPLAADVEYWGSWVLERARHEIGQFYPSGSDGNSPVAYVWTRTVRCSNPACGLRVPLMPTLWLVKSSGRKTAFRLRNDATLNELIVDLAVEDEINFDPDHGTLQRGKMSCPFCNQVGSSDYLQQESSAGRMRHELVAVVEESPSGGRGTEIRNVEERDRQAFEAAMRKLITVESSGDSSFVPTEPISDRQPRLMWITRYGINRWSDVFNARQSLAIGTFGKAVSECYRRLSDCQDEEYAKAIVSFHSLAIGRLCDYNSTLCRWDGTFVGHTFGRQGLPMVWTFCETVPFSDSSGNWSGALDWNLRAIKELTYSSTVGTVRRSSATALPYDDGLLDGVVTDPPYYDAVPYSDLSDFFYVWHKRVVGDLYPSVFQTPLTPKQQELIEERPHTLVKNRKDSAFYEDGMRKAFCEMHRTMAAHGTSSVMFAHKSTTAWETLIAALIDSGLVVTASWPFHTERPGRLISQANAALASSVTLVCRKRSATAKDGLWDDVRQELKEVADERLGFFWNQGIRGADFFISAIGPALSVFGKYERVTKLSGDEVKVGRFLDEVRALVTNYALEKILHTTHTANIDPESQFYVVWKWSYGDAKVPADESFKMAQALGIDTNEMWDKTGVLVKSGENVQSLPVAKRMKMKNLGEPNADGAPASLIDVLHRLCDFREKGDNDGMLNFLVGSGQGKNPSLWLVAQAIAEILPDGDSEKKLMQGLLNQQETVEGLLF